MPDDGEFIRGIYVEHGQMLYRIAFNILRNAADAEDAVQDCFVRVMRNLGRIRAIPLDELRFYLVIMIRNVSLTLLSQRNRSEALEIDEQCAAADVSPEEELLCRYSVEEIRRAVSQLPAVDCEVMWLLLFREFTVTEISDLTGQKSATVRSRICRARRRLRQILEERGIGVYYEQGGAGKPLSGQRPVERQTVDNLRAM